jgi:hypothetical protein
MTSIITISYPPQSYIDRIRDRVDPGLGGDTQDSEAGDRASSSRQLEDRVRDWCLWFTENHPPEADPLELADMTQWLTDFRIFFLAYPFPSAAFLRFVDAGCEVDKAIYGTSKIALTEVEKWRAMDPLKYLLSESLMSCCETDLI